LVNPARSVQRRFVQILHDDIEVPTTELASIVSSNMERVTLASADTMDFDAVDELTRLRATPPGCDEGDSMPCLGESAEHFVEVNFGTTRPWVFSVEPIEDENVERHQHRVRVRLSTPGFTAASPSCDKTDAAVAGGGARAGDSSQPASSRTGFGGWIAFR
jgi:hypothetical protein